MIWFFDQRKQEQAALRDEHREAVSALQQSQANLDQTEVAGQSIVDLAKRLRSIQQDNHFAVRLRLAYKE